MYAGVELTGVLGDVVVLAVVVAFFGLCLLFVRACAAIVGPDPSDVQPGGEKAEDAEIVPDRAEVAA